MQIENILTSKMSDFFGLKQVKHFYDGEQNVGYTRCGREKRGQYFCLTTLSRLDEEKKREKLA